MIKCLAQGHKCHGRDSNPHSAIQAPQSKGDELQQKHSTRQYTPLRVPYNIRLLIDHSHTLSVNLALIGHLHTLAGNLALQSGVYA